VAETSFNNVSKANVHKPKLTYTFLNRII